MTTWVRYGLSLVLLVHGLVYLGVGATLVKSVPVWNGTSWLLGAGITGAMLERVAVVLHVLAGVVIVAGAVALTMTGVLPGGWRPLWLAGGALGIVAFCTFWDGRADVFVPEGGIGALVSAAMMVASVSWPTA